MTRSYNSRRGVFQRIKGCTCQHCKKHYKRLTQRKWNWKKFYEFPYFTAKTQSKGQWGAMPYWTIKFNDEYAEWINQKHTKTKEDYIYHLGNWCRKKHAKH